MTDHTLIERARRLAAILEAENAALAVTDYRHAETFAAQKRSAIAELVALRDAAMPLPPDLAAPLRALGERIESLVVINARALEGAIEVQGRVIDVLARAAARCSTPQRYAGNGGFAMPRTQPPVAFVARA